MLGFIKRPLYALSNKMRRKSLPVELMKEKWVANFSKPERSCFDIKPENFRIAKLEKGSLLLALKRNNRMAWLETANRVYLDQIIKARFRFDGFGGYCAAGIMFRVIEEGTYYLALVSSKGYFRLDAVNNKVPKTLIGWTEVSDAGQDGETEGQMALEIVAKGDCFTIILNGKWVAEVNDRSIPGGHLGFSLVSYEPDTESPPETTVCEARLDYLSVDSRPGAVGKAHEKWACGVEANAESRLRLADTFAATGAFQAAHEQILKAWKQRDAAANSVMATYTDTRSGRELLFAARMASLLGLYEKAEEYINACLSAEQADGVDETEVLAEKAGILSTMGKSAPGKFRELVAFLPDYIGRLEATNAAEPPIPLLYAMLGHAWWNLEDYEAAATAWGRAFELNGDNGLYAENAAAAYDMLGKKDQALRYLLAGGGCFLRQRDFEKLGALVPRLLAVGQDSSEAHKLAGEWARGIGDTDKAEAEFALAEQVGRPVDRVGEGVMAVEEETTEEIIVDEGKSEEEPADKVAEKTAETAEIPEAGGTDKPETEAVRKTVGKARAAKVAEIPEMEAPEKEKASKKTAGKARATKAAEISEMEVSKKAETKAAKKTSSKAEAARIAVIPKVKGTDKAEAKAVRKTVSKTRTARVAETAKVEATDKVETKVSRKTVGKAKAAKAAEISKVEATKKTEIKATIKTASKAKSVKTAETPEKTVLKTPKALTAKKPTATKAATKKPATKAKQESPGKKPAAKPKASSPAAKGKAAEKPAPKPKPKKTAK